MVLKAIKVTLERKAILARRVKRETQVRKVIRAIKVTLTLSLRQTMKPSPHSQ